MIRLLKGLFYLLIVLLALAVLGRIFFFQLGRTQSYSMIPNLVPGDLFAVRTVGKLGLGDVAVCENPEEPSSMVVLRIIGVPGERVAFRHNHLVLDGKMIQRSMVEPINYVDDSTEEELTYAVRIGQEYIGGQMFEVALMDRAGGKKHRELTVPQEHFFLAADNRNLGRDSRHFGPVPIESCVGEAVFVIWPGDDSGDLLFTDRLFSWIR